MTDVDMTGYSTCHTMYDYDITSTVCYCCDTVEWCSYKNSNYHYGFDYLLIEVFHRTYPIPVDTLDKLIMLIKQYNAMTANIRDCILNYHKGTCRNKCDKCGTYNDKAHGSATVSCMDEESWEDAMVYYTGLEYSEYVVLQKLSKCVPEMVAINEMIGMHDIKSKFVKLLKFLSTADKAVSDYGFLMHMMICGPPGHGKTEIAKLLGKAFRKSGLLTSDKFVFATRADLIGEYCGHTAKNTISMFDKARGGVIFIDEVYALGNAEQRDVFTKECIDTINQLLSERTDTLCIISGYEDEIYRCFFAYNKGLERRFPWRFTIKSYSPTELIKIFHKKIIDLGWNAENDEVLLPTDIETNKEHFNNAGGDIANLATSCIISHHGNMFPHGSTMILSRNDIMEGMKTYICDKKKKENSAPPHGMYT